MCSRSLNIILIGLLFAYGIHCESTANEKLAKAINDFSFRLYKELIKTEKENLICSGYSVHCALNLLLAGARELTAKDISDALGYEKFQVTQDELPAAFRQLLDIQKSNKTEYDLDVANSAWIQSEFNVSSNFTSYVKDVFDVEQYEVDFGNVSATNRINQWVSEKTQGRIEKLLEPLSPATRLVLANAVYFKGKWLNEFNKNLSREEEFFTGNSSKNVLMMKRTADLLYTDSEELDSQILELPYNGSVRMLVILPKSNNGLAALEERISFQNLSQAVRSLKKWNVDVTIPKFSVSSTLPLTSALNSLGIVRAFNSAEADLSGITGHRDLFVSDAIQKADIDVDEEGTVASAATAITTEFISLPLPLRKANFVANHPFVYIIQEKSTKIVLFCGRITNP